MNNWTQISTFTLPHEAHLAKARLESEGIDATLKDELTAQVYNFYSNAIGGVKLFVKDSDLENAIKILKDAGIIQDSPQSDNALISKLDKLTKSIPIFNRLIIEFRLIILTTILISLILAPIIIFSLPSNADKISQNYWCVDTLIINGKKYKTKTTGNMISFSGYCDEAFSFMNDGSVQLPGFNTKKIHANWRLNNKKIIIFNSDSFAHIYNGSYDIEFNDNLVFLESDSVLIIGEKPRW